MPNWVNSSILIKSKSSKTIEEFIRSGKKDRGGYFFSSWLPMPSTYEDYDTTNIHSKDLVIGNKLPGSTKVITEDIINAYKEAEEYQLKTYGVIGWYDWSCKYWGTKWNAELYFDYYPGTESLGIVTETAWSPPTAFFVEISHRYPDMVIDIKAHDEGGANYWIIITDGKRSNDLSLTCDEYVRSLLMEGINCGRIVSEKVGKDKLIYMASTWNSYDITDLRCCDEECLEEEFINSCEY